jgi:hypothetical protein
MSAPHTEAVLAAGYASFLILAAFAIEWLSAHTHRRALRYRTAGFAYAQHLDAWQCPEGEHLWPHEFDAERRLVRYRAKAHVCNACHRKPDCTDSDRGREIVRPVDPWPHSEAGRFHRGLSLVLVALATLIAVVEGARHHQPAELLVVVATLVIALLAARRLLRDFRAHPANFPAPAPSHGLRLTAAGADNSRPATPWASQTPPEH